MASVQERCQVCEDAEWLLSWSTPIEEVARRALPESTSGDRVRALRHHLRDHGRPFYSARHDSQAGAR